jgi:glycosyltransferase involved in cell wall biosynthesis
MAIDVPVSHEPLTVPLPLFQAEALVAEAVGIASVAPTVVQTSVLGLYEQVEVSVVLPCLNEAETLETCIVKALNAMTNSGISGEVIVADNGSTDGSQAIAERCGARVVPVTEKGYGSALMGGILAARGRWVVMGDADDSYNFAHVPVIVEKLRAGYDLVMGNRFQGGIQPGAMPPLHRYLGNPVLSGIGRLLFRCPCRDFHCGLRGFRKDAILRLDLRTLGMEFASEMVVKSTIFVLKIAEIPTTLSPDGRSRPPHLRSWRDGWRHLRFLLMYSPRWLFLYPGVLLAAFSALLMLWLLPGPRQIGGVTFDLHALLYAAVGILVGSQAVLFAVLGKVFAMTAGLAPWTPKLKRCFRVITLETGLIAGGVLLAGGLVSLLAAFLIWRGESFGALDPHKTLRLVIPGVVATALGFQVVMASFLLSMMGLARK